LLLHPLFKTGIGIRADVERQATRIAAMDAETKHRAGSRNAVMPHAPEHPGFSKFVKLDCAVILAQGSINNI
jgi:hypothetical protein